MSIHQRHHPGGTIDIGTLRALALSDHEWRIDDPDLAEKEGIGVIGFVQEADGLFEATSLVRPLEWTYFGTLRAAVDSLDIRPAAGARG